MARKPYPRKARGKLLGWYILHEDKQVWLGRFEKEAQENHARLLAGKPVIRPERAAALSSSPTVQELIDSFLDARRGGTESTYRWYKNHLNPFAEKFGTFKATILKPREVTDWINSHPTWGPNMRHLSGRCVIAVFRYAAENDLIHDTPMKRFKKERSVAREGAELTPEEWSRLSEAMRGTDVEDAIRFMRLTGARPQEARLLEARHFQRGQIVFPTAESKGKRQERIIRLPGEALVIVQRLVEKHPTGPLFRNQKGVAWTRDCLARRCRKLGKQCNIPQLVPYSFRITYATESVINKIDSLVLMKLMGHTSTKMLEAVYAKHGQRQDFMLEQAEKAIAGV